MGSFFFFHSFNRPPSSPGPRKLPASSRRRRQQLHILTFHWLFELDPQNKQLHTQNRITSCINASTADIITGDVADARVRYNNSALGSSCFVLFDWGKIRGSHFSSFQLALYRSHCVNPVSISACVCAHNYRCALFFFFFFEDLIQVKKKKNEGEWR